MRRFVRLNKEEDKMSLKRALTHWTLYWSNILEDFQSLENVDRVIEIGVILMTVNSILSDEHCINS